MARQAGSILIRGALDNVVYFKRGGKYFSKPKTAISRERFETDPLFERSRENATEFGRLAKGGKLIRDSIKPMLDEAKEMSTANRLVKVLKSVLDGDTSSGRGRRSLSKGTTTLLAGYKFNREASLTQCLGVPLGSDFDRAAGTISLDVPSFVPGNCISAPGGATHFKLVTAGIEVDFDELSYVADLKESVPFIINPLPVAPFRIVHQVTAGTTKPMMLIVGIQYFQELNGSLYSLRSRAYSALEIVKVS